MKYKKPIYKKAWFWIILSMILLFFLLLIWVDVAIYFGDLGKPYDETRIISMNESLLDDKTCLTDYDCLVTNYRSLQCCVTCVVDPINTKAANERKRWRDDNCKDYATKIKKYSDPSYPEELIPDKWSDCLEYSECSTLTQHYNVFCIDNNCQIIEKK